MSRSKSWSSKLSREDDYQQMTVSECSVCHKKFVKRKAAKLHVKEVHPGSLGGVTTLYDVVRGVKKE